ncbi:hypothetical protein AWENTII_011923 [Aspergillus wentii]
MTPLPAILCLHGHGTNAAIFHLQARRIVSALHTRFRFIFVNAPFDSPPGPGVQPAFTDLGPFYRWHCDSTVVGEFDITSEDVERERRHVRDLLTGYFERENAGEGPGIVGIMAFSQGTRLATGICMDRELRKGVKFAILIGGTFPTLDVDVFENEAVGMTALEDDRSTGYDKELEEFFGRFSPSSSSGDGSLSPTASTSSISSDVNALINIPSIHIQGSADPWRCEGTKLRQTYYNPDLTTVINFRGGHQVPTGAKEAKIVEAAVTTAWDRAMTLRCID